MIQRIVMFGLGAGLGLVFMMVMYDLGFSRGHATCEAWYEDEAPPVRFD